MKRIDVAINGFGRIGRTLLRILLQDNNVRVVAINDLSDVATMAHLFKYDSVHGRYPSEVKHDDNNLIIDELRIPFYTIKDRKLYPWKEHSVDCVIECTGSFKTKRDCEDHLLAGAKTVIRNLLLKSIRQVLRLHFSRGADHIGRCFYCTIHFQVN